MKKFIVYCFIVCICAGQARAASTYTAHFNLAKPAYHDPLWHEPLNSDLDAIDGYLQHIYDILDGSYTGGLRDLNPYFAGIDLARQNPVSEPDQVVWAGGYDPIITGTANYGATATGKYVLPVRFRNTIRQAGDIAYFQMYFASKPSQLTHFYISIWRYNSLFQYQRIYQEDMLSQVIGGFICTLTPTGTWHVRPGDFISYGWSSSSQPAPFLVARDGTGDAWPAPIEYLENSPTPTGDNWLGGSNDNWVVPVRAYVKKGPVLAAIGDSLMVGYPYNQDGAVTGNSGFLSTYKSTFSPNDLQVVEIVAKLLNLPTYQNMAISGTTSADGASRFDTDIVALHPDYCIIAYGTNDAILSSMPYGDYIYNIATMLSLCHANNIIPIVLMPAGCNAANAAASRLIDSYYANIGWAAVAFPETILVDLKAVLSQYREGGDAGNLWDLKPGYVTTSDNIHWTHLAQVKVALAIARAMKPVEPGNIATITSDNTSALVFDADEGQPISMRTGGIERLRINADGSIAGKTAIRATLQPGSTQTVAASTPTMIDSLLLPYIDATKEWEYNQFVCRKPGLKMVSFTCTWSAIAQAGKTLSAIIYKNGLPYHTQSLITTTATSYKWFISMPAQIIDMEEGDIVAVYAQHDCTGSQVIEDAMLNIFEL